MDIARIKHWYISRWEKIRSRGFWRFVLVRGVLAWGIPVGMVLTYIELTKWHKPRTSLTLAVFLVSQLLIFTIAGYFVGWLQWRRSERYYHKIIELDATHKT